MARPGKAGCMRAKAGRHIEKPRPNVRTALRSEKHQMLNNCAVDANLVYASVRPDVRCSQLKVSLARELGRWAGYTRICSIGTYMVHAITLQGSNLINDSLTNHAQNPLINPCINHAWVVSMSTDTCQIADPTFYSA